MLEETIDSSPTSSLNSSIRTKREHRKAKRRRCNFEKVPLEMYFEDVKNKNPLKRKHSNCDRFKAENLMACADRCDEVQQLRQPPLDFEATKQFQTCERLLKSQAATEFDTFINFPTAQPADNIESQCAWIPEAFEDEMPINFLDQTLVGTAVEADTTFISVPIEAKSKSIVETILEDFCTSPVSTDTEDRELLEEDAPFFRFRKKKLRTYELCYRQRPRNLPEQTITVISKSDTFGDDIDESDTDTCSELSVQEDMSQVHQALEPLELNTSSKIHSNLLNLSAFFTQNLLDSEEIDDGITTTVNAAENAENTPYTNIKNIIKELLTLREKYPVSYGLNPDNGFGNFYGFTLDERGPSNKVTNKEKQHSSLVASKNEPSITTKCKSSSNNVEAPSHEYQTVYHEDAWQHDAEFFTNFHTQADCITFETNVAKSIKDETTTKQRRKSDSILPLSANKWKNEQTQNSQTQIAVEDILKLFENPNCHVSNKEATEQSFNFDNMQLSEWPLPEINNKPCSSSMVNRLQDFSFKIPEKAWINKKHENWTLVQLPVLNASQISYQTEKDVTSIGFQTIPQKNVLVATEAEKKRESISTQMSNLSADSSCYDYFPKTLKEMKCEKENQQDICKDISGCFVGFQTASKKSINISEEAKKKAESILSQLPDLLMKNSDQIETPSKKTTNLSKEAESIFAQLPDFPDFEILEQNCENKEKESPLNIFEKPTERKDVESVGAFIGFETASKKSINISKEAEKKAKCLLADLPDLPLENIDQKNSYPGSSDNLQNICRLAPNVLETVDVTANMFENPLDICKGIFRQTEGFIGFQTASRKGIKISEEAQKKAESILAQLPDLPPEKSEQHGNESNNPVDFETTCKEPNSSIFPQLSGFSLKNIEKDKQTSNRKIEKVSEVVEENIFETHLDICEETIRQIETKSLVGFQTVSRKSITISEEARKKAESILAQLPVLPGNNFETDQQSTLLTFGKSGAVFEKETENKEDTSANIAGCFIGFQTASKKNINISEDARRKAESVFAQLPNLPGDEFEKIVKNSEQKLNENQKIISEERNSQNEDRITQFIGFQTASKKSINISEEAKKKAESILAQLPDLVEDNFDNKKSKTNNFSTNQASSQRATKLSKELQRSTQIMSDQLRNSREDDFSNLVAFQTASRKTVKITDEAKKKTESLFATLPDLPFDIDDNNGDNFADIQLSEWIPGSNSPKLNYTPKNNFKSANLTKRKFQGTDSVETVKQPAKIICRANTMIDSTELTPINEIEQSCSQQIPSSSVIVRKNLLSLNNRRKENLKSIDLENNETPVKLQQHVSQNTPNTPYTTEFYDNLAAAAASTPQQLTAGSTPLRRVASSTDNLESDFKRINWENADENHVTSTTFGTPSRANSSANEKSLKAQPSPQERIENLSMCGDPPPLPQLINTNSRSRSLGLSRFRRSRTSKK